MEQRSNDGDLQDLVIGGHRFCYDHPCIVAEIAQAHDGSLGTAHKYIDAVADAGADAIKFQTHIAHAESTRREPWRVKFSMQEELRYDYWRRMEFTEAQWSGLKEHADERGLIFFSSPFSEEAVELLHRVGHAVWKIASGEVTNIPLLEKLADHPLPVIISSGMCSMAEMDTAVSICQKAGLPVAVLQCTTAYPCPPEKIGLNQLEVLKQHYRVPIGLSDHSGTIYAGLAAATIGIAYLEVHATFDKRLFGPDVPASVTIDELAKLTAGIRFIEKMRCSPVNKEMTYHDGAAARRTFGKSIVAARNLQAGHTLSRDDLAFKKPGDGLPPADFKSLIGRKLKQPRSMDDLIEAEHLD